jgi:penicillin-binding protein 1A
MMNAMMRETVTSGTARKADLPGWAAAGKTGTSQDFRDAWFVGYTSQLVTGVWLGNDDSSPTKKATGGGLPVEVWSRFMKAAHQGRPATDLPAASTGIAGTGMAGAVLAGVAPSPAATPAPPMPAAAALGRGREPIRPAEGTIDGWLTNRLFPGR